MMVPGSATAPPGPGKEKPPRGTGPETVPNRYTLWWERSADSFEVVKEASVFGLRGTLNRELPEDGAAYAEGALDVSITSPDDDLSDMPSAQGVDAGRFLIVVGDEIMLGWHPVLTAPDRYAVNVHYEPL
jgi:hypothetical protein